MSEQPLALNPTISRLRFAWLLPCAELGLCGMLLWPMLWMIFSELHIYPPGLIARAMYSNYVLWGARKDFFLDFATMLNAPAGIFQVLFAIFLSPDKTDWNPTPIDLQLWRAITWPFLCLPFWWIAGRALDALIALKSGKLFPRIGWTEAIVGFLLLASCSTIFVGWLIFEHSAKHTMLLRFVAGCGLWAMLGSLSVIARFRQWRLRKKIADSSLHATASV